ncbi:hypothetical protein ERJ75_000634400 [Trypanosoma vivax]|nr:hypothetical protein ERJ75_000634400 [Trypanosoma vivax]
MAGTKKKKQPWKKEKREKKKKKRKEKKGEVGKWASSSTAPPRRTRPPLDRGVLVLLVLGHEIVHVGLCLGELHLVHALTRVPVQERLAAEHGSELLAHAAEHLLDAGVVADEGDSHLEALGRDVADRGLDVVRDPLDEVGRVLVLHVEHLLVDLLCRHAAAEERGRRQVAAVAWVGGLHHVLGVEHLLRQLGHRQAAVLLRATARERGEAHHEEVQTREGHQVHRQLAQVRVELTGEAQAARHTGHPADTRWFRSPNVGVVSLSVRKQMSYRASLSMHMDSSEFSTSWCTDSVVLYGSTTVSDTLGDGMMEKVIMIRSGYCSRSLEMSSVPMPEPVPPPSEWQIWKPCRQSQLSASLQHTSSTESMSSAPSV